MSFSLFKWLVKSLAEMTRKVKPSGATELDSNGQLTAKLNDGNLSNGVDRIKLPARA